MSSTPPFRRIDDGRPAGNGILALVIGPSGAGKDTMIQAAAQATADDPRIRFARRLITRAPGDGPEQHEALGEHEFARREQAGEFLLSWQAHGHRYAIGGAVRDELAAGCLVVANVSRTVIAAACAGVPNVVVLKVTAPVTVLARRLAERGRETAEEIAGRLDRSVHVDMPDVPVFTIVNDGPIEKAAAEFSVCLKSLAEHLPASPAR
jgi:phosphonate metabolism protein PhnN/1,5-bisphosphokinase (PRPP-forming)